MLEIDHGSPVPIYHQLKLAIKNEIESGEFEPGERIPTEQELCDLYGISRTPVRQALKELVYEGLLVRHRALGTFVADQMQAEAQPATTIRLMTSDARWAAVIERATRQWNEWNPHQRVELQVTFTNYDELHQALTTAVAEGTAPDMVLIDCVWIAGFADAGFLVPLDELDADWTHNEYANDLYPAFVEVNRFDGHFYGLQVQGDLSLLWYRKDWFDAEGLKPPADWDELLTVARHFARPDVRERYGLSPYPLIFPAGRTAGEATVYNLLPFLWSAGGTMVTDGRISLDSEASRAAVRFIGDLVNQHAVAPPDIVHWQWYDIPRHMARGEAAMALGGSYEILNMLEESDWEEAEFLERIGYRLPPAAPGREPVATAGGMSYAILRQSRYPRLAMDILKLAVDKDTIVEFCKMTYQYSTRLSMRDEFTPDVSEFLSRTSRLLSAVRARPSTPEYVKVSEQLQSMFETVITNNVSAEDAVRRAAEFIGAITGLPPK